jgi:hypothetical protein
VDLNFTTPLLAILAVVNVVVILARAPRRVQLGIGGGVVLVSALLLKDWVEGLVYLTTLP